MQLQLDALWNYAQNIAASELDDTDPSGFDKIDKQKVEQTIAKIDAALKNKPVSKQVKQKLNYTKKHWPAALDKYEQQETTMGEHRKSYSKTDTDATLTGVLLFITASNLNGSSGCYSLQNYFTAYF